ncbi:MAG TPA: glycosyltransferase family 39 protein, partial [bacterium]|nr:glycosyltransferase family 39 protein [bacterium]
MFLIFFTANGILWVCPLSLEQQCFVLLAGVILPFFLASYQSPREKTPAYSFFNEEFLDPIPKWVWFVLAVSVLFSHFYKLEIFFIWPDPDEGLFGMFGLQLSEKWSWAYCYTVAQHSPLLIWILSFTLPWFKSAFWGLRVIPAVLSIASVFLNYLVLRKYFSKSFSFLATWIWAFSLFSFVTGRLCLPGVFILPWEFICFLIAGIFLKENREGHKKAWVVFLGLVTGLGYFTFPSWPIVALSVILILF